MRPRNIRRHLHVHVQPAPLSNCATQVPLPQQGFHSLNYKLKRTVFKPITKNSSLNKNYLILILIILGKSKTSYNQYFKKLKSW